MLTIKGQVREEIETSDEVEIKALAEYLAFLRFRAQNKTHEADESQLAALYAEFAAEDRSLAEEGMEDYAEGVLKEDSGGGLLDVSPLRRRK